MCVDAFILLIHKMQIESTQQVVNLLRLALDALELFLASTISAHLLRVQTVEI